MAVEFQMELLKWLHLKPSALHLYRHYTDQLALFIVADEIVRSPSSAEEMLESEAKSPALALQVLAEEIHHLRQAMLLGMIDCRNLGMHEGEGF